MKKYCIFLLFILSSVIYGQEQKLGAIPLETIAAAADDFVGFDKFGYLYLIKNNTFIKWKDGKTVEYKNVSLGKMARVDIENPLLIVLFYENFNTIVLLDNQLNEIRKVNFVELNLPIVAHGVGLASQNRLWIYDNLTQQIGLYDFNRNTYQSITTPFSENLKFYQTDYNYFQWLDEKGNLFSCDVFGKVSNLGKSEYFGQMQFLPNGNLLYQNDGGLYLKSTEKNTIYTISGIGNSFKKFYYKDQILSIFTDGGITNYKITIP